MREKIQGELQTVAAFFRRLANDEQLQVGIEGTARAWQACLEAGGKILLAGNGGSAADAQHIAAELVCRYRRFRRGVPAFALHTDTSVLTAIGNDFGYEQVFSRQVEAVGRPGDVFVGLTTSGRSENVLRALEAARHGGLTVMAWTGAGGAALQETVDHCLVVPEEATARIQEAHGVIGHILCGIVEDGLVAAQEAEEQDK